MRHTRMLFLAPLLLTLACGGDEPRKAAAGGAASPAAAVRADASGEADTQELADYVLTMDDVRKWSQATRNLRNAKPVEQQSDASDDDDDGSIDAMERKISANPQFRAEVEKAGLEPREYVVIMSTMVQASMLQYALEQGANRDSVVAKSGVNPANLEFVRAHKQELEQLQKAMQAQ